MQNNPPPHRISILLPALPMGGVEKVMLNLAKGLDRTRYAVDIVLFERTGGFLHAVPEGIKVHVLTGDAASGGSKYITLAAAFRRYVRSRRPAVVLSAKEQANALNVTGRLLSGIRYRSVITRHVPLDGRLVGRDATLVVRWLYRTVLGRADRIIAVSNGIADEVRSLLPKRAHAKIGVIGNPVVDDTMLKLAEEPVDEPWLTSKEAPVVVASGRLSVQKGYDVLLDAFERLRTRLPARLLILGEGELKEKLAAQARNRSIAGDVKFLGAVRNPYPYYRRADVFAMPSRWEGQPFALIEALALGAPVVASDCRTGPAEILQQGRYGFLVPPEDPEALADALYRALRGERPDKGSFNADKYTVKSSCETYSKMLEALAGMR